jgi:hypothetical protein
MRSVSVVLAARRLEASFTDVGVEPREDQAEEDLADRLDQVVKRLDD